MRLEKRVVAIVHSVTQAHRAHQQAHRCPGLFQLPAQARQAPTVQALIINRLRLAMLREIAPAVAADQ